jgi:putative hemolysin
MTALQIAYLAILTVCVPASGFFSGSETALVAIPRERVAQLLRSDRRAVKVESLIEDPDLMLSTLLVANNFVNILAASVATVLFVDLLGEDWGPWLATLVVTSVILLLGEITPKRLATRYPERFSLMVAPVIYFLAPVLRPVSTFFLALSRGLIRPFGIKTPGGPAPVTVGDIRAMAEIGERSGHIATAEREIIHALFGLDDRRVQEVMTPRTDIHTLVHPVTIDDVRQAVAATGRSRYPVVAGDLDHLIGVLHVKDLLRMSPQPTTHDIERAVREPVMVPENKPLLTLLGEMRSLRRTIVFVLDEHGGIEGLVTIQDLVSELIGELQDEFEAGPPSIVETEAGRWMADGRVAVDDLDEVLGSSLPRGPYATVGGLILDLAGRIPEPGSSVQAGRFKLTVVRMGRRRVASVRIEETKPIS